MAVVEYDVSVISIYNINAAATKPCSYTACQYSAPAVRVAIIWPVYCTCRLWPITTQHVVQVKATDVKSRKRYLYSGYLKFFSFVPIKFHASESVLYLNLMGEYFRGTFMINKTCKIFQQYYSVLSNLFS